MGMSLSLGLSLTARRGGGGGGPSPLDTLATILAPYKGGFWRFGDLSTVFESADTSDPAEVGDGIQYMVESISGTVTPLPFSQGTLTSRPTLQAGYASADGGDFLEGSGGTIGILNGASAACLGFRARLSSLATNPTIIGFSRGDVSTGQRLQVQLNSDGDVTANVGRTDGTTQNFATSSTGFISVDTDISVLVTVDFATGGAGAVNLYLDDGAAISDGGFPGNLTGTGNVSATDSLRVRMFQNVGGGGPVTGRVYSVICANFIPTADERATIFEAMAI